jgi:putative DNA primase/helicase
LAGYPYEFDLSATCPEWKKFLSGIFSDDDSKKILLQEWFGYNLIPDNSYEKFMMLLGPPRAGKGTILEVLAHILGEKQIVATTFRDYTRRFGLYPFIGKLSALIGDVSVGLNYDATEALNVLKRITGNDVVTIEQKGQDITQTCIHLNTRFTMAANTMPRLPDFVRAIESRILTIQFLLTFAGREDCTLKDRLKTEASGILLWALDGLKRLRINRLFTLPAKHNQILVRIRSELTPFAEFVDDCCDLGCGESFFVPQGRLYECWKVWASKNGELGHSVRWLVRVLISLYPTCGVARHNFADGSRLKVFTGIKLQQHAALEFGGG